MSVLPPPGCPPEAVFAPLAGRRGSVLLESSLPLRHGLGRWSVIAAEPLAVFTARGRRLALEWAGRPPVEWWGDPWPEIARLQREVAPGWRRGRGLPFSGGLIGYLGYELGGHLERLPAPPPDDLGVPDCVLGVYCSALCYDHATGRWWGEPIPGMGTAALPDPPPLPPAGKAISDLAPADYRERVRRIIRYIAQGDVYQVNLTRRLSVELGKTGAWLLYRHLRRCNPAPYAAFMQWGSFQVVGCSPERFLWVRGAQVRTRPMKGTRPRGDTRAADRRLARELRASEKDRAELAMIVDVLRNDLGRVCRYGSVLTPALWQVERYACVHQMVARVCGELRPGVGPIELLAAAFPGGSITGAPKIRAMEIIAELEPHRRGHYTGALGYVGWDGAMDMAIAIRTGLVREGWLHLGVGGGIVADSDPAAEWEETCDKARGFLRALACEEAG